MGYHFKGNYSYSKNPGVVGSKSGAYWSKLGRKLGTHFPDLLSYEIRVKLLVETAHDKESSLSPKLTMSMNFYF